MNKNLIRLLPPTALALLVGIACNAVETDPASGPTSTASSSSSGQGGSSSATGANGGSGGDTTNTGGGFNPSGTGGTGGGVTCLTTSAEAQKKPLDIVIVWDRSGSMSGTKWTGTVSAVTQFVNDPASAGVSLGINFFPLAGAADECDPSINNPPQVPLTELPAGAQTLVNAINATSPGGGTPTYGAMFGTLQYLTAYQDMNPDRVVVAVLASDGVPTSCNTSIPAIASLAQSAYNYNGLRTYCVAIQGSNVAQLNQIAAAGGTGQAFDVTTDISLFKQKMDEIRASALGCEYPIPEPAEGEEFESTKLNLTYTPGGSGTPQTIPQADNAGDCASGGWYYDDPQMPTQIFLCPSTCTLITGDTEAQVEFQFGCPTVVN